MFSARQAYAVTLTGSPSRAIGQGGLGDRGRAGHVALHGVHGVAGLDGETAGVEGDALADQREVGDRLGGGVAELDQPGRGARAAADAEQTAAAELGQLLLVEDLHPDLACPWPRAVISSAKQRRGQVVGRGVHPVADGADGVRDDLRLLEGGGRLGAAGGRAEHGDGAGRRVGRLREVAAERVGAEEVALGDVADQRGVAGRQREGDRRGVARGAGRDPGGASYGEQGGGPVVGGCAHARPAPAAGSPACRRWGPGPPRRPCR